MPAAQKPAPALQRAVKPLLLCGILSALLFAAMNAFIPLGFEGYSYASHTVSEVSAIGAPTRPLWMALGVVYELLFAAFGLGVWLAADGNRRLRVVGGLIIAYAVINVFWPSMHLRGEEKSLTDTLHVVWAMEALLLMVLMMIFGAAALGGRFRIFTFVSMALHIVFGILTSLEGPKVDANLPTPLIGVWERINIAIFLLWVTVLAIVLLQKVKSSGTAGIRQASPVG